MMLKKFKFTDKLIKALKTPPRDSPSTELEVTDTQTIGLKCLVGKTGNKRFLFRYTFNQRKQSVGLGRFSDINVVDARKLAQKHRMAINGGINPKVDRNCPTRLTIDEFFQQHYLPSIKKRKKSWRDDLYRYDTHIAPGFGQTLFQELRTIDVQQLHLKMMDTINKYGNLYAPATANQVLMILKSMTKYAIDLGVIEKDTCKPVKLFRLNNARTHFLTTFEIKRLLKTCREYSNKTIAAFIATLALTGLRCGEVSNIKVKDVDIKRRIIHIPITKNFKPRTVFITDLLLSYIANIPLKPDNPYLFAGRVKGQPLRSTRKTFFKLLKRAQVNSDGICQHSLRHSVASNLVSNNVSLRLVQEQLAHKSIISTQRYAKVNTESMRQTSETLSNMFG
ncbi:MAG: site-specific integrase [Colwellia sp.]|nr:site-specific integrase [Colwellia sp.]